MFNIQIVRKISRYTIGLLSLLVVSLLLFKAVEIRLKVLDFYFNNQQTIPTSKFFILLPNMAFFVGMVVWYLVVCSPWFKKGSFKRLLLSFFMAFYLFFSWFLDEVYFFTSSQSVYSIFFNLTQFDLFPFDYVYFKVLFWILTVGVFFLSIFLALQKAKQSKSKWYLASLSIFCIALSFTQWEKVPRYVNLSSWPFILTSASFTPDLQAFLKQEAQELKSLPIQIKQKPNIAIIVLETTRRDGLSFYNPESMAKTPWFDKLALNGAAFTQMQTIMPNTIKSLIAINCGLAPYLHFTILESVYGLPVDCLAKNLRQNGYETRFMQSSTKYYANINALLKQFGYHEMYSAEDYPALKNYKIPFAGTDDRVMLEENERWLNSVDRPFLVNYLTTGAHWPYKRYDHSKKQDFLTDDEKKSTPKRYLNAINDYRNAIVYQDQFLELLFQQYEMAGKLDNTIFILVGDHGQGNGEHAISQRLNSVYEEALAVPFVIYAPKLIQQPEIYHNLLSHSDIPRIISNLLNEKPLLDQIDNQAVFSSCWYWRWCIARKDDRYKYIHNFSNGPDELYDLIEDAEEKHNIALGRPDLVDRFRNESLSWFYQELANYGAFFSKYKANFYLSGHPKVDEATLPDFSDLGDRE